MARPWLETDIWQQTADHLTVPVQLVFDRGTEMIISLKDLLSPSDLFLILKPIIVFWQILKVFVIVELTRDSKGPRDRRRCCRSAC